MTAEVQDQEPQKTPKKRGAPLGHAKRGGSGKFVPPEGQTAAEQRQWKLAEELKRMREQIEILRTQLFDKTASGKDSRKRLRELELRMRRSRRAYEKMQTESKRLRSKTKATLFKEDWARYDRSKKGGAPNSVLTDQVKRILRQYKDTGVDLSSANRELLRLLRGR